MKQLLSDFWLDKKNRQLAPQEKLLLIYLLSNAHNNPLGVYYLPHEYIACDLDWDTNMIDSSLSILCSMDFISYVDNVVWIKDIFNKFLMENEITTIKQLKFLLMPYKNSDIYNDLYTYGMEVLNLATPTVTEKPIKRKLKNTVVPIEYSEDFKKFWEVYPKQTRINSSYTAYNDFFKVNTDISADTLLECAKKYSQECSEQGREEKYIKSIKNFLDGFYRDFLPMKITKQDGYDFF